ncbi:MAG: 4a-hydroxytetrahydrobiopterin dehydratase [Nanobdellota archaeon]
MEKLKDMECSSEKEGKTPMDKEEVEKMLEYLSGWEAVNHKKIKKVFSFSNFDESMIFVNKVAGIAQAEDHHPTIHIDYDKVIIEIYTHKIGGLHKNDFIIAAKIDSI